MQYFITGFEIFFGSYVRSISRASFEFLASFPNVAISVAIVDMKNCEKNKNVGADVWS